MGCQTAFLLGCNCSVKETGGPPNEAVGTVLSWQEPDQLIPVGWIICWFSELYSCVSRFPGLNAGMV